jgi:1-pyrroline-5-carboxylate dehydrogenase
MKIGNFSYPLPANEPVLSYAPGTKERDELKKAMKALKSKKIDVPMYIVAEEEYTDNKIENLPPHEKKFVL